MKASAVSVGDTVLCCVAPSFHEPQLVVVTRILRPEGSRRLAFAYTDTSGAAADTRGVTSSYLPNDVVPHGEA